MFHVPGTRSRGDLLNYGFSVEISLICLFLKNYLLIFALKFPYISYDDQEYHSCDRKRDKELRLHGVFSVLET